MLQLTCIRIGVLNVGALLRMVFPSPPGRPLFSYSTLQCFLLFPPITFPLLSSSSHSYLPLPEFRHCPIPLHYLSSLLPCHSSLSTPNFATANHSNTYHCSSLLFPRQAFPLQAFPSQPSSFNVSLCPRH